MEERLMGVFSFRRKALEPGGMYSVSGGYGKGTKNIPLLHQ